MKNYILGLLCLLSVSIYGQDVWMTTSTKSIDDVIFVAERMPNDYRVLSTNLTALREALVPAPQRFGGPVSTGEVIVHFPDRTGALRAFHIQEAPIMEKSLALRYPMIRTYVGQGIDDITAKLYLSIGTDGVHVMVTAAGKPALFIDPYTRDRTKYILYSRADLPVMPGFECRFDEYSPTPSTLGEEAIEKEVTDGVLREYNLAVATTIEYSDFHLNNQGVPAGATTAVKKAAVLSAITTTINRVRGIYETEVAATFVFNANQDDIIFIDADNFSNDNANALIGESQTEIDNIIGNGNYDVGHTFSTGGGGLASLGGICTTTRKARAITGSANPIGDPYDVDFVAHEIGHHFGANHSYNGDGVGNCTTSNAGTAAEPGSGTTIMAYAGICGSLNVENNSDAYFHTVSLKEINDRFTNSGNYTANFFYLQCSSDTNTGNQEPIADAGQDYTIPSGTAFVLSGSANDPDGDALTYCWDQLDLEQPNVYPLASTTVTGPLYRSLSPTNDTDRYLPKFETVFGGSLATEWEVTPTVGRNLNFSLTVRDNRLDGGQNTTDEMLVMVIGAAGPFTVTSQTTEEMWSTGQTQTIDWDVAGTTANGINTANVEIALVDENNNVLSVLEASTSNDGSQDITVPNITEDDARIRIRALNNIYYALNAAIIAINTAPGYCDSNCASSGNAGVPDGTTRVIFNMIDNVTTGNSAYSDFTNDPSITTNVAQGADYDLTVNVNTDGNFQESTKVWIDWNRDCVLDDATEFYDLGTAIGVTNGPTSNSPLTITVPGGASLGETMMRVTSYYSGGSDNPAACDNFSFGEVEDYSIQVVVVLPIELTMFTAKNILNNYIQLNWETVTERNNAGFELQRSQDGDEFHSLHWTAANGDGNSNKLQQYQYVDDKASKNERYYYRLKQVDHDGAFTYSEAVSAILKEEEVAVEVYPNPVKNLLFVQMNRDTKQGEGFTLTLYDALGKKTLSHVFEQRFTELDLTGQPAGIYFYQIFAGNNNIQSAKLILK